MNFFVINASPKTKHSITLQHLRYFEKEHPQHQFEYTHVGNKTAVLEKKTELFEQIVEKMLRCDAVIWCFPVYYALVPSQLKRFIELLFEHCPKEVFKGKYATSFTTSINFFDHTAHNYMQGVCEDLGFRYIDSYSAHMHDFFSPEKRGKMNNYFDWFAESVARKVPTQRKYHIGSHERISYRPDTNRIEPLAQTGNASKVLLLTDEQPKEDNLAKMTGVVSHLLGSAVTRKNIYDIDMKNGCMGCCSCGRDNQCIQKDGFVQFYNTYVKTADTIIIAGSIRDHYLSAQWKKFFDRSFFNGHAPVLQGKRIGFIVSGNLSQYQNLRETFDAMVENWHMKTIGIVTDEHDTGDRVTKQLISFSQNLVLAADKDLAFGSKFYHAGGQRIFRDFIYETSAVFKADDRFYKKIGLYDTFPQRQLKKRFRNAVFSLLLSIKPIKKKIYQQFIPGMVAPYKKVLNRQKG